MIPVLNPFLFTKKVMNFKFLSFFNSTPQALSDLSRVTFLESPSPRPIYPNLYWPHVLRVSAFISSILKLFKMKRMNCFNFFHVIHWDHSYFIHRVQSDGTVIATSLISLLLELVPLFMHLWWSEYWNLGATICRMMFLGSLP